MRNANVAERDTIIFGEYDPRKYSGGIRSFEGLTVEELKTLVQKKPIARIILPMQGISSLSSKTTQCSRLTAMQSP